MAETIILMKTNMTAVSVKTGIPYDTLEDMYQTAMTNNNLVVLTISDTGEVTTNEPMDFDS